MTDIDKLRSMLAAAPPTPWVVEERDGWWEVAPANPSARPWPSTAFDDGSACGEYFVRCSVEIIIAAVNALPELLAEIERLKAELLVALKVIDHAYCWTGPTDWQMQKEAWDFLRRHKESNE